MKLKYVVLFFLFVSGVSKAQLDTLLYFSWFHHRNNVDVVMKGYDTLDEMLDNSSCHYINLDYVALYTKSSKKYHDKKGWVNSYGKETRKINKIKQKLESKLQEVKVLYVLNPSYQLLDGEFYLHDTVIDLKLRLINNIHLEKFTSLQTLYIHGNDADPIVYLPDEFYQLSVKKVYMSWLNYPDLLEKAVKAKRPDIEVIYLE